jgi:hypothetical protein
MSNTRKITKPAAGKTKTGAPALDIPLPGGGRALFYSQAELTPRRTRDLDVLLTHLGPRMRDLAYASEVLSADGATLAAATLPGPAVQISRDEAAEFAQLNDLAAWVYLKDMRDSSGQRRPLPDTVDGMLDLPTPIYKALVAHAAELVAASMADGDQWTVAALDDVDDADDADPDLPTSA